jgi:integrase
MIKNGEDIKMVSERLGHSDVAFTIRTYHHVLPKVEKEAVVRFDDILLGKKIAQESAAADVIEM